MAMWQKLPGLAKDIAVDSSGIAWIIGTNPVPGGFGIYRWNVTSNNWDPVDGGGVRIACGRVSPIVVNDVDNIYHRELAPTEHWRQLSGKAKDVGAEEDFEGGGDHICAIGTHPLGGGFGIYFWNHLISDWTGISGAGVAISGGYSLFVINDRDEIYNSGVVPSAGGPVPTWPRLPGAGKDIGANLGNVWLIGTNSVLGGYGIYHWNATTHDWDSVDGGAVRIACGRDRTPWVVNDGGEIFRRVP